MAAQNGHLECVKLLLQFNATVNGEEATAINRIGKYRDDTKLTCCPCLPLLTFRSSACLLFRRGRADGGLLFEGTRDGCKLT